jgi:hypothetical protein
MSYTPSLQRNVSLPPAAMTCPISAAAPSRTSQAVRSVPGYAQQKAALSPKRAEPTTPTAGLSHERAQACRNSQMAVGRNQWVGEHAGVVAGANALGMQASLAKSANVVCDPAVPMTDATSTKVAGQLWSAVAPGERRYDAGAAKDRKDGDGTIEALESTGRIADFLGSVAESCLMTVPVLGLSFRALRNAGREMSNEYFNSGTITEKSLNAAMLEFAKDTAKDIAKAAVMGMPAR